MLSSSFFDAGTPLNDRILSLVFVALWVLAQLGGHHWLRIRPARALALALGLLCAVLLVSYGVVTTHWARARSLQGGIGYGSVAWRQSPTIALVRVQQCAPIFGHARLLSFTRGRGN